MAKFKAAAIQMDTTSDREHNLHAAATMIEEAAGLGARLVALPETMSYEGPRMKEYAETIPGGPTFARMAQLAKRHRLWLHCGSIHQKNPDDPRPYNTTMLISPLGELAAVYQKIHTFHAEIPGGPAVHESDWVCPGDRVVTVDAGELGRLGLSICYDIRFPELYRLMALEGAHILLAPADFSSFTGKDHWKLLLRARAVENGCYVIAPAQCGQKLRYTAYGHSMIIDPWGRILAEAEDAPAVITAEIDTALTAQVRGQLSLLQSRREDVYRLERR
jgi:predicted amidohydrolase